jgi:3'-phosphoadenosine 5'-phosphosulfate sulfotransferase (PAPS reductase)/FAD synthetase
MSQETNLKLFSFKKLSELLFDLSKNTIIAGVAYLIFNDTQSSFKKLAALLSSLGYAILFFRMSIIFYKKYITKT